MTTFSGSTKDANAPILAAGFWKKGKQIIGKVVRSFQTDNGLCYTIETSKPTEVDRVNTYPRGKGIEQLPRVSVGSLKGFEMALQTSGIPDGKLLPGDRVQITCTGKTPSGKGSDQVDFDVQIDRGVSHGESESF